MMRKQKLTPTPVAGEVEEVKIVEVETTEKIKKVRAPIKKVPEDQKDEKYWAKRKMNSIASRRSREKNNLSFKALVKRAKILQIEIKDIDEKTEKAKETFKMLNKKFISEICQGADEDSTL